MPRNRSLRKPALRYKNQSFLIELGAHCRKLRVKQGLSIDRMAKAGDQLSPGAIQRLESGTADVHVSLLFRCATVLGKPIRDLVDFDYSLVDDRHDILPFVEDEPQPRGTVPFYPIEVAAGAFKNEAFDIQPYGWVAISRKGPLKDYFAARISGRSMEPTIRTGSLCLFRRYSGGSRNGLIMLVQARGLVDPESGGSFVVKRYQRITPVAETEDRQHVTIHLLSDNPSFKPIVLRSANEGEISTPAVFVEVL